MQTIGQIKTDEGLVTVAVGFDGEVELSIVKDEHKGLTVVPLAGRHAAQLGNMLARAAVAADKIDTTI